MQLAHQSKPVVPRDKLIRLPEVEGLSGCKKSTVYTLMKKGEFPEPVRLSARMVAWSESAVLQWVQDRIQQAGTPLSAALKSVQDRAHQVHCDTAGAAMAVQDRDRHDRIQQSRPPLAGPAKAGQS